MTLTLNVPISNIGWWNTSWVPKSILVLWGLCQKVKTKAPLDGHEPDLGSGYHVKDRMGCPFQGHRQLQQCLHSGLGQQFTSVGVSTVFPQLTFYVIFITTYTVMVEFKKIKKQENMHKTRWIGGQEQNY